MENKEIAQLLYETADLMEVAGEDGFRIRSYRNAASVIQSHPERVAEILSEPGSQSHRHPRYRQRHSPACWSKSASAAPSTGAIKCSPNIRLPRLSC